MKGVNRKRALFFLGSILLQSVNSHVSGFAFWTTNWIFLKVHSLWLLSSHMFCVALVSCCLFDAAKYYAVQVKHVTLWELAELIPAGPAH